MRLVSVILLLLYFQVSTLPADLTSVNTTDTSDMILFVQKQKGSENKYDKPLRISTPQAVNRAQQLLEEGKWSKVKFERQTPPTYKLYFQPTDGREIKAVIYDVWFTNGYAEIYITELHSYKRLNKTNSGVLKEIITSSK
ncbi:hypothetical protein [Paenibacillus dakarensis]|uniref:hypothetical protein n=1 Tax=Paenibacillus dakarensis TaxID=1527293 RepID=UPI0006D52A6F|nr:hypothetical protein [Paenibacillus dakarensis]